MTQNSEKNFANVTDCPNLYQNSLIETPYSGINTIKTQNPISSPHSKVQNSELKLDNEQSMETIKTKEAFLLKQSTYIKEARQKSRKKWLNQNRNLPTTIKDNQENPPSTQNLKPLSDKVCLLNDSIQPPTGNKVSFDTFKAHNDQNNNSLASLKKSLHDLSKVDHPNQFKIPQKLKVFKIMPLPNHNNSCFLNAAVQSLFQIKSIRNAIEALDDSNNNRLSSLKKLFLEYPNDLSTPFRSITYGKIANNIRKSLKINETGQHDAIECFQLLLQELIDGAKTDNYDPKPDIDLNDSFELSFTYTLTCQNCLSSSKTTEKGLSILNSSKDKNLHTHLLDAEQTGTPNIKHSEFPCLCHENNKLVTKKLSEIKSNQFLIIMFECKFIPQKISKYHPFLSSSIPP